ncbi:hypothetical protein MJN69_30840, partial [Salmonella enterica subsp. enterica serovar Kentucky]|nr:hypothetical protein [Salmonella enterica subsp. enterica serovar Kentucky]
NNKYDLLIDTLDRLVVAAIVSNAIDATSGGKVKALIIAHGYSPFCEHSQKIGRMGRFRLLLATVGTISGFTVYHRYFSLSGFS